MPQNRVTKEEIMGQIQPGIIYLTKGTSQQIKCLLDEDVVIEHHYSPTTTVFRQWLLPNPLEDRIIARIIYYPQLEGTGRVRDAKNTSKEKYGSVSSKSLYAIPNDQTVTVPKNVYFFIVLVNPVTGEVEKKGASALQGDYIQELDLQHVVFIEDGSKEENFYPLTTKNRRGIKDQLVSAHYTKDDVVGEGGYFEQVNPYIEALTRTDGATVWYDLGKSGDAYKLFLVSLPTYKDSESKTPLILKVARAWCLQAYLEFFLTPIRDNRTVMPVVLAKFASWVHTSSTALSSPGFNGLYWYAGNSNKQGYWVFRPSKEAKLCMLKYLDQY